MLTPSYDESGDDYPNFPKLEDLCEMDGGIDGLLNQAQVLHGPYAEIE